jgi:hypothetical protein
VPELDLAPPFRAACEGTAGGGAPELVVVHGDVDLASATL